MLFQISSPFLPNISILIINLEISYFPNFLCSIPITPEAGVGFSPCLNIELAESYVQLGRANIWGDPTGKLSVSVMRTSVEDRCCAALELA